MVRFNGLILKGFLERPHSLINGLSYHQHRRLRGGLQIPLQGTLSFGPSRNARELDNTAGEVGVKVRTGFHPAPRN